MRIEVTYLKTRFTETFNDKMSYEKLGKWEYRLKNHAFF